MSKLIDIYNNNLKDGRVPMFSFEYFPPKTDKGVEILYERLDRMGFLGPSWIDVTWGAGGSTSTLTQEICKNTQNFVGLDTLMHMTCTNISRDQIKEELKIAQENGIKNILALRGDPPRGEEWKQIEGGFSHAIDLVKFIRSEYGNYFGITVAGYPEGHIDATSYEEDLQHLKEKVDAGAELVITQLFYDTNIFLKFVQDCRNIGITVPIIPGIMPIHTYAGFVRMTALCKTFVPKEIHEALEPIKHDDEAVKNYGVQLGIRMCKHLIENGVKALHFYTLNLEKSVTQILEGLNLIDPERRKPLPWRQAPRLHEAVRPIFWSQRPKSYTQRTCSWDEFPNGRWGDSRSPAYGDLTDYHLSSLHLIHKPYVEVQIKTPQDVFSTFVKYCIGDINALPWCESPLSDESKSIRENLIHINKHGFLTINSQPRVNGVPSNDETVGWGPKNGYVYQKAYVEFFTSPENLQKLLEVIPKFPDLTYHAVNWKGDSKSNLGGVSAITWGVFPGKEIQQPTVVDASSFLVWKDEAFALWQSWAKHYPPKSEPRETLESMIHSYYLVNIVDHNFISGNIFAIFDAIIKN